jgi:hypothetical protein
MTHRGQFEGSGSRRRNLTLAAAVAAILGQASSVPAAVVSWVTAGPGTLQWATATNWSTGLLPGADDDVVINVAGLPTVNYATITSTINSAAITNADLTVSSGTLTVTNAFTHVGGTTTVQGGSLLLNGLSSMAALNFTSGTLGGSGTVNVAGSATWAGGTMAGPGTTNANGGIAISGNTAHDLSGGRVLNIAGTATWSGNTFNNGGRIGLGGGAQLNNSGLWLDQNGFDAQFANLGGGGTFNNSGTYTKTGASTTTVSSSVVFNNTSSGAGTGIVNVNAGTLVLSGGGTSNGTFNLAGGSTLQFGAGTYTFNNVSTGASAGRLLVSGATLNVNGAFVHAGATEMTSGALNVGTSYAASTYQMSGGTVSGPGTLNVAGLTNWAGGTMAGPGTTNANGGIAISGNGAHDLSGGRVLNIAGTATWSGNTFNNGGRIGFGGGAQLNNSGLWLDQNGFDAQFANLGGGGTFNNSGTYTKSGNTTTTVSSSVVFNNTSSGAGTGIVNVNAGTLVLGGGGTSNGTFNLAAGTTLDFSFGTYTFNNVSTGASAGRLLVSGATLNVNGAFAHAGATEMTSGALNVGTSYAASTYQMSGGTVSGPGTLNVAGLTTWAGGTMAGPGTTNANGGIAISGNGAHDLIGGRVLNIAGTATWSGNTFADGGRVGFGGGAQLNNSGLWLDQNAFNGSIANLGGGGTFNNSGTYTKSGNTTTTVSSSVVFNNTSSGAGTGIVNVNAGTLVLGGGGTSNGTFNLAAGTTLDFSFGTYTFNNVSTGASAGRLLVSGATLNVNGAFAHAGATEMTSGALNVGTSYAASTYQMSGGTVSGPGTLNVAGLTTWAGGTMAGPGTTNANGGIAISGNGAHDLIGGRVLNIAGTATWSGNTSADGGRVGFRDGAQLNNSGLWLDQNAFNGSIANLGGGGTFNNSGTYTKSGNTTTTVSSSVVFNNTSSGAGTGIVNVNAGTLVLGGGGTSNGTFNLAAGTTLDFSFGTYTFNNVSTGASAGRLLVSGATLNVNGAFAHAGATEMTSGALNVGTSYAASTYQMSGGTVSGPGTLNVAGLTTWAGGTMAGPGTTNANGGIAISGNGAHDLSGGRVLNIAGTATWSGNTFAEGGRVGLGGGAQLNNSGLWLDQNAFNGSIANLTGGTSTFNNSGTYTKSGASTTTSSFGIVFNNTGTTNVNAGTLSLTSGMQGNGAVNIGAAGALALGAASTVGALNHGGAGATSLSIGTSNFTVSGDYANASFGVGNAFNRYANVSRTTGAILAGGDANQAVTAGPGTVVAGGATATPTLTIGNVHVGATTYTYDIANTGTTGPSLRGAIQTNVGGANITDARLSGNGVTSSSFGPVATGATASREVTVTIAEAGAIAPLVGQVVGIVNNFQNLNQQLMTIQLSPGAAAFNLAAAAAVTPNPVDLGNQRVGGTASAALTIANVAPASAFTEGLNASFGPITGSALTNGGSISLLAGGASNGAAMAVRLDGASAGAKNGTVQVNFASDGTGTSGLGITALPSQLVTVTGSFFNAAAGSASPSPVSIGNQRVGGSLTQALSISNTAPAGAFTEVLNASFGANTGGATNNGGSISGGLGTGGLAAGAPASTALAVGVNTATAGAKSGSVTVNYASNGLGTSGLAPIGAGSQLVNVSGNVYQLASGQLGTAPLNFGTVQVGQSVSQALSISNVAVGPAGFVEDLNASFGSASGIGSGLILGAGSISGLVAGATNAANMVVSVNTAAAGTVSGSIAVNFFSAGTVGGVSNGLGVLGVGSVDYGVSGVIEAVGQVVDVAVPVINNAPIDLGAVRVGAVSPSALVSVTNQATGNAQAALNASIVGNAPVTAAGSFNLLAPGATNDSSLSVGMNTAVAGAVNGTATVSFVSDASNVGGCEPNCQVNLASQNVAVTGRVYQVAQPTLASAVVDLGNVRATVGASQALSLTNTSVAPAGFQEALNASFSGATGGVTTAGAVNGLAQGATDGSTLVVGFGPGAAGAKAGTATLGLVSSGVGTSGLADLALASQLVTVNANFFRLATGAAAPDPIAFGNVRVGGTVAQSLTVSNTAAADGFSERLNAAFTGSTGSAVTTAGTVALLNAGASSGALSVVLGTATAGAKSGTVTVGYASDGAGTTGAAAIANGSQVISFSGNVYQLASGQLGTAPLNFGTVQVGQSVSQALSISNVAVGPAGFVEDLNASFGSASGIGSGLILGAGSISGLVAGATNAANMVVSVNTAAAGTVSGSIAVNFFSAGTVGGVSNGLGVLGVGSVDYGVSGVIEAVGQVVDVAVPVINNAPIDLGAVRVGAVSPSALVSVTNQATGNAQAALNASIVGNAPVTAAGSFNLLAPGATNDSSLSVGMNTAVAGAVNGTATVSFVSDASNVGGCEPNCQVNLAPQNVAVTGKVYAPAVAQLNTGAVNFGIVHVGDVVPTFGIDVSNVAPTAGLNDTLAAGFGSVGGPFTGIGSVAGIGPGLGDDSSLRVGLNTAVAGVFNGSAEVTFASRNPDMADLALAPASVALVAQVNNFANPDIVWISGGASLSRVGDVFTLDFGRVLLGSDLRGVELGIRNAVAGPADFLEGSFAFFDVDDFGFAGFDPFEGLGAAQTFGGLRVNLDPLSLGSFQDSLSLTNLFGSNASGFRGAIGDLSLVVRGIVVQPGTVPEPGSLVLMILGLGGIGLASRRRMH